MNDKNIEQILEGALELLDGGKSQEEILSLFPEHQEALKEIFSTITLLEKEKMAIVPPKELLEIILKHLSANVTEMTDRRYLYNNRGEKIQSRPSISSNQITNMINKTYLVGVVVLLVLLGGGIYWYTQQSSVLAPVLSGALNGSDEPEDQSEDNIALIDESPAAFEDEAASEVTQGGSTAKPTPPPSPVVKKLPDIQTILAAVTVEFVDEPQPEDSIVLIDESPAAYEDEIGGEL